jgi:hypothetical protein
MPINDPALPDHMTWQELAALPEEVARHNLPDGVVPLRPRNYILIGEWTRDDTSGIDAAHPFPIQIGWDELAF